MPAHPFAACLAPALFLTPLLHAQAPAPLIASVKPAPYRASINVTFNLNHQRFDMRNATIVNMIDFAHNRPDDDGRETALITGGPTWLDFDRYDITLMVPETPTTKGADPYAAIRPIIERILLDRFHLKYHTTNQPLPGFIITAGKDATKLTPAKDPSASPMCRTTPSPTEIVMTCTSETLANLVSRFSDNFRHPIIDHTGLTRPYDFTLRLNLANMQSREDTIHEWIDVFAKQLGLIITPGSIPQLADVVDSVERPTPDAPQVEKQVAALPDIEFEVASVRRSHDAGPAQMRVTGSQITLSNFVMVELLRRAWQLRTGAMVANQPSWLTHNTYTIVAKFPTEFDANAVFRDPDQFSRMLQKLLIERFQIKYHWGEQQQEGFVFLPGTPKMKRADPASRSYCKYGPPEGEKDLRRSGSMYDAEFHCQNVTMDQFADLAQPMAGSEIKNRATNKTGLSGAYDFTLYYTSGHKMRVAAEQQTTQQTAQPAGTSADPVEGLPLEDAVRKQLGIRLERQNGTYPALILDHIEETPTEN